MPFRPLARRRKPANSAFVLAACVKRLGRTIVLISLTLASHARNRQITAAAPDCMQIIAAHSSRTGIRPMALQRAYAVMGPQ